MFQWVRSNLWVRNMRSNLSRNVRRLLHTGDVQVLSSDEPQSLSQLFELYLAIERRSWMSHTDGGAVLRHPRSISFFRGLLDERQPMRVSIDILLLDGAPIAGLISGAFDRCLYLLQTTYDEQYTGLGPGNLLLYL